MSRVRSYKYIIEKETSFNRKVKTTLECNKLAPIAFTCTSEEQMQKIKSKNAYFIKSLKFVVSFGNDYGFTNQLG